MAYRDELDAARARSSALDAKVAAMESAKERDAQELARLRGELATAKKEAARLAAFAPGSAVQRSTPHRLVIALGLGLVVATAIAGYANESLGVTMSYFAAGVLGAGCGGWVGARFSRIAGVVGAGAGACQGLLLAWIFYSSIWPSL
jgi:hypothetical protein